MGVILLDRYNNPIKKFKSWSEANKYRIVMGRMDWKIVNNY